MILDTLNKNLIFKNIIDTQISNDIFTLKNKAETLDLIKIDSTLANPSMIFKANDIIF